MLWLNFGTSTRRRSAARDSLKVPQDIRLMCLPSRRDRREFTAAHHFEKSDDLMALQDGPVNVLTF